MEKVISYLTGFFGGLVSVMIALVPVSILWVLLTGLPVFGMDIIGNFTGMVTTLGDNGFVGLLSLLFIMWFFIGKGK